MILIPLIIKPIISFYHLIRMPFHIVTLKKQKCQDAKMSRF